MCIADVQVHVKIQDGRQMILSKYKMTGMSTMYPVGYAIISPVEFNVSLYIIVLVLPLVARRMFMYRLKDLSTVVICVGFKCFI